MVDPKLVKILPITSKDGITYLCLGKTNATGYELYSFFSEANGQLLPLAFIFTKMTDRSAKSSAKQQIITEILAELSRCCPNIKFTLSDKDPSEINACCTSISKAKHQLCSWHGVRYIEERLAEDKPPAAYDPQKAQGVFEFIDPTWAPGVTRGDINEYMDGHDVEKGADVQGGIRKQLQGIHLGVHGNEHVEETTNNTQNHAPTTLAPLVIIKAGNCQLPIWLALPPICGANLSSFCLAAYCVAIKNKFVIHFHQHPEIPVDAEGTHLTAIKIYWGAVFGMYTYCQKHGLSQVWAYLWNCLYSPKQWPLWAWSAASEIPWLKAGMISEAQWKVIKHNDLGMFNQPQLNLVVHVQIT